MVPRETLSPKHYFDLEAVWFSDLFQGVDCVWDLLKPKFKEEWITSHLTSNISSVPREGSLVTKTTEIKVSGGNAILEAGSYLVGNQIELKKGVLVEAGSYIAGPTILGEGTVVRHGAYIRGGVITGTKAVIGHASEIKSSIMLNESKAPHFAYVGDSILGNKVNLGAGTKVSNLKITNTEVIVRFGDEKISTGLRKFGAIVGDHSETGCNSVLNPGVLLAKNCLVYPAISVRKNYYGPGSFIR